MMPSPDPLNAAPQARLGFESDALRAVAEVRGAFTRIIESKGRGMKSVGALSEAFGVHRKLAWQISKVAYESDPFLAARHMPNPKAIETWLLAAGERGVEPGLLASARSAALAFESVLETHARTRTELEMLLESCAPTGDPAAESKWREQAYLGNSFTWGAHCRALLAICVLTPSEDRPRHFHAAQVRGLLGFRQTRPGVRWIVNQSVVADDESKTQTTLERTPLDPHAANAHGGVPILPRFCSTPTPAITRRVGADGMVHDEFLPGPVGQSGERTLVTGELMRNIGPDHATEHDKVAHFGAAVRTPAELLHFDLFVHHALFGPVTRELRVFSDLATPIAFDDADALCVSEPITRLGRGIALSQTPDIPGYADLASAVFDALRVDHDDYDLYRVRLPFPPMPTTVMLRHELLAPDR
jgi:hypothetical protein